MLVALFTTNRITSQSSYSINWFTDSDGLPQNSIKDIFFDKYGFVWLSTENGIVRYDGLKFKLFNDENILGINANRIRFFEGKMDTDSIYTLNELNEAILIRKGVAKKINNSLYTPGNYLTDNPHYINFNGMIGGYRFIRKDQYLHLNKHDRGHFMIGKDTVREFNGNGHLESLYHFPIKPLSQFFVFGGSLYVLENQNKLLCFQKDGIMGKHIDPKIGKDLTVYINGINNQLFLYSHALKSLYLIEAITDKVETRLILENFDFKSKMVWSVCYNKEKDILFLGSTTHGLCIIKKNLFKSLRINPKNHDNVEYAMTTISDSTILTASGGIIFNKELISKLDLKNKADKYGILKDRNGDIWSTMRPTLYKLKREYNYKEYDSWKFDSSIKAIFIDEKDILWIATDSNSKKGGAIFSIDIAKANPEIKKHVNLNFMVSCMASNHDGTLFIGGLGGFYKFDPKKKEYPLEKIKSLGDANVRSIYKTGKDVWVTTYGRGFFLYDTNRKKAVAFPLDQNKFLATAHCIVEDQKGFFWITTNKGLFQVSKQSLYHYASGKIDIPYYHYYDKSSGFVTNEFNGGCYPCGTQLPNNQIYIPSLHGVVTFNASKVKPILPEEDIYFNEIEIDGKRQFIDGHFQLNRKFGRLTFFISSPNFGHFYNNKIEVQLKGVDKQEWTLLNQEQTISYTNLTPGDYTLTARKLSGFNSEYIHKSIAFYIPPAFWQTLWFKILLGLIALLCIFFFIKIRTHYIRHKNILLEKKIKEHTIHLKYTISSLRRTKNDLNHQIKNEKRLVRSITHDIKSPLKYLAIIGKNIYENSGDVQEDLRKNIKSMYTSSFQLYHFIDNVLDYYRTLLQTEKPAIKDFNLHYLVKEKAALFNSIALSKRILLINNIPSNILLKLNKQLFSIIIHNLLDNAVKNTFSGKIVFDFFAKGEKIIFSIKDDGSGMDSKLVEYYMLLKKSINKRSLSQNKNGLGLKIIIEILIIMNGDILIKSQKDVGTEILLIFDSSFQFIVHPKK